MLSHQVIQFNAKSRVLTRPRDESISLSNSWRWESGCHCRILKSRQYIVVNQHPVCRCPWLLNRLSSYIRCHALASCLHLFTAATRILSATGCLSQPCYQPASCVLPILVVPYSSAVALVHALHHCWHLSVHHVCMF